MPNISGENYQITYNESENCVVFDGTLRLRGLDEYKEISDIIDSCLDQPNQTILNLKSLAFLNSSGIAMLSRFVIKARKSEHVTLLIQGSKDVPWQGKSLKNLQRLMPELELVID